MSKAPSPFRYFRSLPEVIPLVVMINVRFPLSLRNVEDLLFGRWIDLCHETVVEHIWPIVRRRHSSPADQPDARVPPLEVAP